MAPCSHLDSHTPCTYLTTTIHFHSLVPYHHAILACGVCSSAQDFWVRIREGGDFESNSVFCAASYVLSSSTDRFDKMIQCYLDVGLTEPCATLWAHFGAVNVLSCSDVCIPDENGITTLNEDPPSCEFGPCLQCSSVPQIEFDLLSGRTWQNSGVTERIVRPCSAFSRIDHHDHCVGTTEFGTCGNSAPTAAPQGTNGSAAAVGLSVFPYRPMVLWLTMTAAVTLVVDWL